jgi:putative membrane protein
MSEQEENKAIQTNINTELAKHRTHEASDRTMMAWVRTSLSLMGFGIGIYEIAEKTDGAGLFRSSKLVGLALILLSVFAMVFSIIENKQNHKKLENADFIYQSNTSLGVKVGYVLIIIAIFSAAHIISKFFD